MVISGRVQGVYYRAWTTEMAKRLGLVGWVRNRSEGTVEAVFQGPEDAVTEMLADCQHGPIDAIVKSVEQEPWPAIHEKDFTQQPTV